MIVTEHPAVTEGGRTTYTIHIETEADAALLRRLEAEGVPIEQFASAFKHNENREPMKQKEASAKKARPKKQRDLSQLAAPMVAKATKE